jgi:hypothetical protein
LRATASGLADDPLAPPRQIGCVGDLLSWEHVRVDQLPVIASSCSLDPVAMRAQLERYRTVGRNAEVIERERRRLTVRVGASVPDEVVAKLMAVERECCPFFGIEWEPEVEARRLTISVPSAAHEPALDAIGDALGGAY